VDSWVGWPGDGRRQPRAAGAMVEVASGDARRRADMGTMVVAQLWERRRAQRGSLSTDERASGDGDSGAPVTAMVALR
jgi:hypothetical protein